MKRITCRILLLISLGLASGCIWNKSDQILSLRGFDENKLSLSSIIDSVEIIPLDISKPFRSISKLVVKDSLMFLQCEQGLFVYNLKGEFKYEISKRGRAKNEWTRLDTFILDEEKILVLDGYMDKVMYFSADGEYLYSHENVGGVFDHIQDAEMLSSDKILLCNTIFGNKNTIFETYDLHNKQLNKLASTPVHNKGYSSLPTGHHQMSVYDGNVLCVLPKMNIVYRYEQDAFYPYFKIETNQPLWKQRELASIDDYTPNSVDKKFSGFSGVFETENYYVLNYYDLFTSFVNKKEMRVGTIRMSECFNHADLIPIIGLLSSDENTLYGSLDSISFGLLENNYESINGSFPDVFEKVKQLKNKGYDTFIVKYKIR